MAGNVNAQHLAGDAPIEAFDHAVGLRRIGPRHSVNDLELRAGTFEIFGGNAGSPVRQHMGDAKREGRSSGFEEDDGVGGILGDVDGEMDKP